MTRGENKRSRNKHFYPDPAMSKAQGPPKCHCDDTCSRFKRTEAKRLEAARSSKTLVLFTRGRVLLRAWFVGSDAGLPYNVASTTRGLTHHPFCWTMLGSLELVCDDFPRHLWKGQVKVKLPLAEHGFQFRWFNGKFYVDLCKWEPAKLVGFFWLPFHDHRQKWAPIL